MLNLDDRLIKETLPIIKPNGLAVLLVISIHLNKESGTCFPSHERLMKMTGLGSESVYNALKSLKKAGLLISTQSIDSKTKTFSRRTFKLNTDYIGIWVAAKNAPALEIEPLTDLPYTAEPHAVEPHAANHETYLLNELERLNKLEQLNNNKPAAAEFLIKSTTEFEDVTLFEKFDVEAEKENPTPVPPPPPQSASPTPGEDEDAFSEWLPSLEKAWEEKAPGAMPRPTPGESAPRRYDAFDMDQEAEVMKQDYRVCEKFAIDLGNNLEIAKGMLPGFIDSFVSDQKAVGQTYNNRVEFRKHFFNLVRRKQEIKRSGPANQPHQATSALPRSLQSKVGR